MAADVLATVRLLKTLAVVPAMDCTVVPASNTPALEPIELSVKVPLLVKSPKMLSEAVVLAAKVTEVAGDVLLMVKVLQTAAVPALITGILAIPVPFVITMSVVLVGSEPLHQLLAVPQLLVAPSHPPLLSTVNVATADVLVHGVLDVMVSLI